MASIPSVKPSARIRNVKDGELLQDSDIENDLTTPKPSNKSKTLTKRPLSTSRLNDVKSSNTLISKKTPVTVVSVPGAKVSTTPTGKVVTTLSNRHPTTPTSKTTPGAKSSTPNTKSLLGVKNNGGVTPSSLKNGLTPSILTKNNGPTTPTTPRTLDSAKGTRLPPSKSSSTNTPTNRKNHIGVKRSRSTSKGDEILRREGSLSKYLSSDSVNSSSRSSLHTSTPSKSPRTSLSRLRSEPLSTGKNYTRLSTNNNDRHSSSSLFACSPAANAPQIYLTPESGYMSRSRNESTSPLMFPQPTEESTAVKVGVRIRPMNKREKELPDCHNVIEVNGTQELVVNDEMGRAHSFAYDHCFWSCNPSERIYHPAYATQETVYNTIAKPLLDKALEGYNVCLFAYGQTGSGKSFTMLGDEVSSSQEGMLETAGVIPRFCQDLFQCATQMEAPDAGESSDGEKRNNAHVEVQLSYIEIYNERIYDLLGCSGKSVGEKREALRVREHPQNGPYVEGVKCHPVSSFSDLQTWLVLGNRERSIAATGMNDKSSRSHAILTLQLTQTKDESIEGDVMENRKDCIINMVDLAGSERIGTSLSHGDRLKEGVCINKSLLTLGKVITALSESNGRRRPFIPYRESTLTYLLKESLGGNSRTAMIATVSPASDNIEETLSTLRYASQARKILNVNHINEDPKCKLLKELAEEVAKLRAEKLLISPNIQTKLFQFSEEESSESSKKGDDDEEEERKKKEEEAMREKELKEENERAIQEREREIALLKEKLCSTQQQFLDQKESWEKRLQNAKDEKKDALDKLGEMGIASQEDEKGPLLVNLCEDPQLSGNLSYKLKTGITTIGHSHSDLILKGLHNNNIHCTINSNGKQLVLTPKHDTETFINGKLIVDPTRLHNDDRLVLAGIYFFRVANPTENSSMGNKDIKGSSNQSSPDFFAAKEELLKIQEEKLRAEAAAQEASVRAQLEEELCCQRDKFLQKVEADKVQQQTLLAQLEEEQQLRNEMEEEQWRLQENNRILEAEMQKKSNKMLDFSFERPATIPQSNFFAQVENLFDESMQALNTTLRETPVKKNHSHPLIGSMIKEANQICKKLGKPYEYQQQEMLRRGGVEKQVLIKDTDHNLTATCSIENFIAHLHKLRDIIRGEEDENDMVFETGLSWEKTEDVSRVPGFLSRLQMSFNASSLNSSIFNASVSFHHPVGRVNSGGSGRRSSLFSIAEGSCNSPMATSSGLTSLAGILHQSLVDMTFLDPLAANIHRAFNSTIKLYNTIKRIVDHVTEPGATLSEEQVGVQLVNLCLGVQSFVDTVMSVSYMALVSPPSNDLAKVIENLQEGIRNAVPRIKKCASRLLQGVRTDAESLIEEEGRGLLKEAQNIVENLAKLTVTASLSAPDTITLIPGSILCDKFVCGASSGLEMLVSDAANMAQITAKLLTDMDTTESTSCHRVVSTAKKLTIALSSFLHKFATLSVAGAWEAAQQQQCSSEELHLRLGRWVGRVEAAADTTSHLTKAIHQIKSYMQEGILCGEPLERAVGELHSRLQEMTSDAGLKPISATANTSYDHSSTLLSVSNNSFSSNSSMDSSTFLDTLQKLYSKITRTMQNLQWALLENRDAKMHMKLSGVGQWQPGLKPLPAAPVKSALKNTLSNNSVEEKKVRFKVSLSPSTPDSQLSPTSSSSTDDEC